MLLVPLAGAITGGIGYWQSGAPMDALALAARGALTAFGGWALAREIAPDDNPGAFASMALAVLALLWFPDISILPLFTAIMLARIVNRSVGYPALVLDSVAVLLLAGWTAYSNRNPGILLIVAAGFALDALLTPRLPRQWIFAMLSGVGAVSLLWWGPVAPAITGAPVMQLTGSIAAIAALYALLILLTRRIRSAADNGTALQVNRIRAAMAMTLLLGGQGAIAGNAPRVQSLLIWAVIAGLLLLRVLPRSRAAVLPLIALGPLACAGSGVGAAQQSLAAGPPGVVDTLIDVGDHRLHFRIWQRPGALTLVFEAGGGSPLASWGALPDSAARTFSLGTVAYDRAGLGWSEVGSMGLTPEEEIRDLGEALDRIRAGRVILVGHSYGGLLSFFHALRYPERVAGLVLVDPMNTDFIHRVTLQWLQTTVPDVPHPVSPRDTVISRMKRTIADLVTAAGPAIASLEIPMVVVTAGVPWWGDATRDAAWRASHETIARMKTNRRLLIAMNSRHGIPDTEPDRILEAIRTLLTLLPEHR